MFFRVKIKLTYFLILSLALFFLAESVLLADDIFKPVQYPLETISIKQPYFFWQDLNISENKGNKVRYQVTLSQGEKEIKEYVVQPKIIYQNFYFFKIRNNLEEAEYSYKIEKLVNNKKKKAKYYYFQKYPFTNKFIVEHDKNNKIDRLPVEYLIQYKYLEKNNLIDNGYPFLFTSFAGVSSFGLGVVFYKFITYGWLTKLASGICFTSSAFALSTSGYYGFNFLIQKKKMQKILDFKNNVSLRGIFDRKDINAALDLQF